MRCLNNKNNNQFILRVFVHVLCIVQSNQINTQQTTNQLFFNGEMVQAKEFTRSSMRWLGHAYG